MPDLPVRKVTIFVSSPTDVMAERQRTNLVIDRLRSRYREYVTIESIFFEEREKYYTADKSFQAQIPDAGATDLVISIFWGRLGSELAPDLFGTMPDGRPYPGGAVYELTRAIEAKRQKNLPDILVYRKVADTGISVTDPAQRRLMNAQLDALEAFWQQWFVSREGHFRAGFQTFQTADDFERLLERHLRAWLNEQGLIGKELIWRIAERGSPFRGLEPYEPQHAEVFFGREREIDRGRDRLLAAAAAGIAFLLIIGPSGVGKSSLARAGLVTRLTRPGDVDGVDVVRFAVMRPGQAETPQRALAQALFRPEALPGLAQGDFQEPAQLAAALAGEASAAVAPILRALDRLATSLKASESYDRPVEARLLLIVDQLEELFSATTPEATRTNFVRLIEALARSGRVFIVATLRSSAYGDLAREPQLVALKDTGATLDVAVPGPDVLGEIVRKPAAAAGLRYDRNGEESLDEVLLAAAGGNADALPLLGFTLEWLFEKRDGDRLTFSAYDQLGGLEGAIGRTAEQAFISLDPDAQAALPQLLRGLAEPTRRATGLAIRDMPITSVPEGTPARRLADALVTARVLLIRGDGQEAMLRLTHDAVLRGWARARDITAKEQEFYRIREEVTSAERRWRDNRRNDLLLAPGLPLAEAQSLRATYGPELAPGLVAFIDASTRREQARQRRGYLVAAVFGLVAVVAIGAFFFAWRQQQIAEQNLRETLITQSRFLAEASARSLGKEDAATAMLAALEALPDVRGAARPYAPEAEVALFSARQRLQEIAVLDGHTDIVRNAAFSPDGRRVVTASYDKTARVFDVETARTITVLAGHRAGVYSAAFSPDGRRVVTASTDQRARIWDIETGQTIKVLDGHTDSVWGAAFSPDGRRVVTVSDDKTARIWDAETGQTITELVGHSSYVWGAAFSPDGRRVVTASADKTARIWDAETGQSIAELIGHSAGVHSAAFSSDGRRVLTASDDKTARLWEAETGHAIAPDFVGHTGPVVGAAFSPDGRRVVTASVDNTARVWDTETRQTITILSGDMGKVWSAAFSPDGQRVVTASDDMTARIWYSEPDQTVTVLNGHTDEVHSAAFSPDGQRVVTGSQDKQARIWDVATGKSIVTLNGHTAPVWDAAFSPDGRRVVTASEWDDMTARIWDAETGQPIPLLLRHGLDVNSAAFSPDGRRILTASSDTMARIWDVATGRTIELKSDDNAVFSAAFSPDGRRVVTASDDPTAVVKIWDAETGRRMVDINGHADRAMDGAFNPDGRWVVSASWDRTALISDAQTGRPITRLTGHTGALSTGVFSPDGRRVLTASTDRTARIWDVETGQTITVLSGHTGWVWSAAFSPDGRRVVTASADKTARIWRLFPTTQDLIDDAKRVSPRCLTREQRGRYFLDPAPPAWCIEMEKRPYNTEQWKSWLIQKKAGKNPPLPNASAQ